MDSVISSPKGILVVKFVGGPRDGEKLFSIGPPMGKSDNEAQSYWTMLEGGASTMALVMMSPLSRETMDKAQLMTLEEIAKLDGQPQMHIYKAGKKVEEGDDVTLEIEYAGLRRPVAGLNWGSRPSPK